MYVEVPVNPSLVEVLRDLSVRWGDFTLKSGVKSDLYVDVRKTVLNARGARLIAQETLTQLLPDVEAIGGVELGAVPAVGAILALDPLMRPGFVVRKAAKDHGTKSRIENCPPAGTRVAIVEDVTTTGGSLIEAILAAQADGLLVVQAVTVVDRQEGAIEFLFRSGYFGRFTSLVTRKDLLPA